MDGLSFLHTVSAGWRFCGRESKVALPTCLAPDLGMAGMAWGQLTLSLSLFLHSLTLLSSQAPQHGFQGSKSRRGNWQTKSIACSWSTQITGQPQFKGRRKTPPPNGSSGLCIQGGLGRTPAFADNPLEHSLSVPTLAGGKPQV